MKQNIIVVYIQPFALLQKIEVCKDGIFIDEESVKMATLEDNIFALSEKYKIKDVDLTGSTHYAMKTKERLVKQEQHYNKENLLNINIV
jgi:hypothetical protein